MQKTLNEDEEFFKGYRTPVLNSDKTNQDVNRKTAIPKGILDSIVTKDHDKNKPTPKRILEPMKKTPQKQLSKYFEVKKTEDLDKLEEVIGVATAKIANDVNANCIVSIEKSFRESGDPGLILVKVVVFKKVEEDYNKAEYQTKMKHQASGSVIPIKELLMEAINKKYIQKGDRIVCVGDESVGMGYKGLIFIFDVDKIFFNISTHHLTQNISTEVLEAAINMALEIGEEGREGRSIGTGFIIGKRQELLRYAKQLVINPFSNYPEEARLITDPNLRETIKGFAQLDGVFMIDENGVILTAGTLINMNLDAVDFPELHGFGTRHRYAAAITKITDAVAVVVSESGGVVRVFKEGKIVMKLP